MTKEEIISMLSKELNSEWTNGVTCLMVENSDSYIPVIVHHNKNELIVEVGEQDKKIYRIGRNELNSLYGFSDRPQPTCLCFCAARSAVLRPS